VFIANASGDPGSGPLVGPCQNTAFCYSYNSVCVGGYFHNRTVGPQYFADDITPWNSGWVNYQGREKPDLAGPSDAMLPVWCDPASTMPGAAHPCDVATGVLFPNHAWEEWSGTSFAAPFVVGTAALMMENFPQYLINDPTLTRAVLMASASHSFPGSPNVPIYSDAIDDPPGAGAPRGDRAQAILQNQQFFSRYVDRNVNFTPGGDLITALASQGPLTTISLDANDNVRIVLTYDQCPVSTTSVTDHLSADLDLIAYENSSLPLFSTYHVNNSHLDNTEILAFSVPRAARINIKTHV
jgi:subtilisin family serine protease